MVVVVVEFKSSSGSSSGISSGISSSNGGGISSIVIVFMQFFCLLVFIPLSHSIESIQAAEKLIRLSQVDNGDEDGESVAAVPPSVQTDLQLLELLIKSKI